MKRGFKTQAEKQAIEVRQSLSLRPWERLPAARLAQELNVEVIEPGRVDGLTQDQLQVLLQTRSEEWSAVTLLTEEGTHLVIENPSHSTKRKEATLLHELAHILRKHRPAAFSSIEGLGVVIRGYDQEQEDEADFLGRCLHLPKPLLNFCLNRSYTAEQISDYAHASVELVKFRLNISGVLAIRRRLAAIS